MGNLRKMTWAVLLAQWVEFAQSSAGLPNHGAWGVLREVVPDVIMLQAIIMALGDLSELDPRERALGIDRAAVLIEKHCTSIENRLWPEGIPQVLRELIEEAQSALALAQSTGTRSA